MENSWTLVNGNHNCSFYDVKHLTKERDISHSFRFRRKVWSYSRISPQRPHWGQSKVAAVERSLLFSTYLKNLTINPLTRTQSSGPHLSRGATLWEIPHLRRWRIKWLVPLIAHSRPQSLRSFWPAAEIESSRSNHFGHAPQMKTELNRMGRIRLFPLLFQNGCSQSSRFLPQARRIVGSGDENAHRYQQFQFNGFYLQVQLNISVAENLRSKSITYHCVITNNLTSLLSLRPQDHLSTAKERLWNKLVDDKRVVILRGFSWRIRKV